MLQEITNALQNQYFPTSKFDNDFKASEFLELKKLIENTAESLRSELPSEKYNISVNTGQGKIAFCPWIGVHSLSEAFDSSSTKGIYITIIWKYDGSGVCLSLQKGTDNSSKKEINDTVNRIRIRYGVSDFSATIALNAPTGSVRPENYEQANIIGREYLPAHINGIEADFKNMLIYYEKVVIGRIKNLVIEQQIESDEIDYQNPEIKPNKKVETAASSKWKRDPKVRDRAIENAKYLCEVDFEHTTFHVNGYQYMEGHHLVPMQYQEEFPQITLDFEENIVSLCPTCHRKIHYGAMPDIISMVENLFKQRQEILTKTLGIKVELVKSYYDRV